MSPAVAVVVSPNVWPLSLNALDSFFNDKLQNHVEREGEREILENKHTHEHKQEPNIKSWHHINQVVGIFDVLLFFKTELFKDVCSVFSVIVCCCCCCCWGFTQHFNWMTLFLFSETFTPKMLELAMNFGSILVIESNLPWTLFLVFWELQFELKALIWFWMDLISFSLRLLKSSH